MKITKTIFEITTEISEINNKNTSKNDDTCWASTNNENVKKMYVLQN